MAEEEETIVDEVDPTHATWIGLGDQELSSADYPTPTDRAFRDAWEPVENAITVNIAQAKDIWRDKIRIERAKVFLQLDADFMKALETGADTSAIVTEKQRLRDCPAHPDLDAASTPDEIKAFQPITGVTIE